MLGIFLALMASIFNGVSLSALKPVFDIIEKGREVPFQLSLSEEQERVLSRSSHREELVKLYSSHSIYTEKVAALPADEKGYVPQTYEKLIIWWGSVIVKMNLWLVHIKPSDLLLYVCFGVLPVYLLKLFSVLGTVFFTASSGLKAVRDVRRDLYDKLQNLPLSYFVTEKTGILMSRILNDVLLISNSINHELRVALINFFIITTHVALLSMISFKLLLICTVFVPLILWPVNHFAKKIKGITGDEQSKLASLNGHLQEVISGIRVIRAFNMEGYEMKKFDVINEDLYRHTFRYWVNHTIGPALVEFTTSFIVIGLLVYGGLKITEGEFTSGSFLMFLFTLLVILSPVKQMASWYNVINRTVAAGERIFEIMDRPPEIADPENPLEVSRLKKQIEFKKVNFSYEGSEAQVLRNISIKVKIGSTVALVGQSGAGKSTFVDLIPRFYDPVSGGILADGIDIRNFRVKDWRDKIGVVTQEIFLFNGTIRENIAYGREEISLDEIKRVAHLAFADEFIEKLPAGYDTQIGERGLMLSGGQRQRISIARALLKDPELLILDEATSALDTQSERLVQRALETLMQSRTTFVIAHRLSTVFRADQILVVDKGRIIEKGTHKELLKKGGKYKALYSMQFQDVG